MTKKTFLLTCLLGIVAPGIRALHYTSEHVSVLTDEDEWFSLTGGWYLYFYNWNIDRHMIHGFQVINN